MNMKKIIVVSIIGLVLLISFLLLIRKKQNIYSTITLDINPSIKINLDINNKVINVIALNDDAKEIVSNEYNDKNLEEMFELLVDKLTYKGYFEGDNSINVIVYSNGEIDNNEVASKMKFVFGKQDVHVEMIMIDNISIEDEKLAEKYNVSPAKIAYINTIVEENENVDIEELVNKSVNELSETKESRKYCKDGYNLEGDWCYKEINRTKAVYGETCPKEYTEYEGNCYKEANSIESDYYICRDDFKLINDKCVREHTYEPEGKCEKGDYDRGKCIEKVYLADAIEFCRDPGRTLYNHKCLATKPSISGGCLGNDMYYNGKCLNPINDYYMAEWKCPDGRVISRSDGSLLYEDKKCYSEKETAPTILDCGEAGVLKGSICVKEEIEETEKERLCPNGYTLTNNGRCINYSQTANKETGFVCKGDNTRLKGNICITYEVIKAELY